MLGESELTKLIFDIQEKITKEIIFANRSGEEELTKVLKKYGFEGKKEEENPYINLHSSKILIIGNLLIDKNIVNVIAKRLGIDTDRIDYVSHEESTNFNYESLRYSNKYSDVIFGGVPHSARGMNGDSSIIVHLENNKKEYPRVIRAMDSNGLALNKTSIKKALMATRIYSEM